jgi:hypothetical protein
MSVTVIPINEHLDRRERAVDSFNLLRDLIASNIVSYLERRGARLSVMQRAHLTMLAELARIEFVTPRLTPRPSDYRAMGENLVELWQAVDPMVSTIGAIATAYAPHDELIEYDRNWIGVLHGALEGNASYDLSKVEQAIAEEMFKAETNT